MMKLSRQGVQLALIGVGLVLAGLLMGILVMLVMQPGQSASPATPQVERVELGREAPVRRVAPSDTSVRIVADAFTLNEMFKEVALNVTPAVVFIQVEVGRDDEMGAWFDNFRGRSPRQSVGSGVIISENGYVVTNNHVVEGARRIQVTLQDKRQYTATVVGLDPSTDLGVLKIEDATDLSVIPFGNSDDVQVGEWVMAVGNPFRLTSTVTAGIVSALGRQVNIIESRFGIEDFIQTDAAINPGNSGGALVNLQGELIGISTAIATESGSYEGYGFAVPVNLMQRVVEDLIAYGEVQRGFLGVEIRSVTADMAQQLGLDHVGGVFLFDVWQDGAAYAGGLRSGDVVLSIEGQEINAPNELQSTLARHRPGDALAVKVWRNGGLRDFRVRLFGRDDPDYASWFQEAPAAQDPAPALPPGHPNIDILELAAWGLGLQPMSQQEQNRFGVQDGAYVAFIQNGSPAAQAGLPRDVVIVGIGNVNIADVADAQAALNEAVDQATSVVVRVRRRDGLTAFYEIEVPAGG